MRMIIIYALNIAYPSLFVKREFHFFLNPGDFQRF